MVREGQSWGKEFPLKAELALARENNSAVIRELQRMQDDADYVSQWTPKTLLGEEKKRGCYEGYCDSNGAKGRFWRKK